MKKMKKIIFLIVIALGVVLVSCKKDNKEATKVHEVSSGNELLSDDVNIGNKALYLDISEKESELFERSFENSPPLIPHSVKGMYAITRKTNECILCHIPNSKKDLEAKSVPISHFTDYRPQIVQEGDLYVVQAKANEVVAVSTGTELNKAMFYCNLCHAPQAEITVEIKNSFKPDFRNSNSKKSSNLSETMNEGVN